MNERAPNPEQVARWAGRKVRPRSVLGEALEFQHISGETSKPYGDLLERIAQHPDAESAFEAVVDRHRHLPDSERLAERLLYHVISAALRSSLANPSMAEEKSVREERVLPQRLSVAEYRMKVEECSKRVFDALTVLEQELVAVSSLFDVKSHIVCEVSQEDAADSPPTSFVDFPTEGLGDNKVTASLPNRAPYVGEMSQDLLSAVAGYAMALDQDGTTSGDLTTNYWRDRLLYFKSIPAILGRLRAYLEDQRRRDLLAVADFPTGRNQRQEPNRKAFTLMVSSYVKQALSVHDHEFVCDMLEIFFPREKAYEVAAIARFLQLEANRRQVPGFHEGADGSKDDEPNPSFIP